MERASTIFLSRIYGHISLFARVGHSEFYMASRLR